MKSIIIAICAGLVAIGAYSYLGLGVDVPVAFKTALVFFLIFGVSGMMGIFGMVPFVKSASERAAERDKKQGT